MDNLTHSLAGLAIAKLASRSQTSKSAESRLGAGWHRWIVFVSILANKFPDIDLVYSTTSKLDYLVHHRGLKQLTQILRKLEHLSYNYL